MRPLERAHSYLTRVGFRRQNPDPGGLQHVYRGSISVRGAALSLEFIILDESLIELPVVRLCDPVPSPWDQPCTHIGARGYVCYARRGEAWIRPWDPEGGIAGILEKTRALLARLAAGDPLEDAPDDFPADWSSSSIYADLPPALPPRLYRDGVWLFNEAWKAPLLTRNEAAARARYEAAGIAGKAIPAILEVVDAGRSPRRLRHPWPPKNLHELHEWLAATEPTAVRSLSRLLTEDHRSPALRVLVLRSPTHWHASLVDPRDIPRQAWRGRGQERYRRLVEGYGQQITVDRWNVQQVHPEAWVSRNLGAASKGLIDQRVILVGCGAIGSYLAQGLAQLGAGQGTGKLHLIDADTLQWGNLGRHLLGAAQMGRGKAAALAELLRAGYPGVDVNVLPEHVLDLGQLPFADLLVDATGSDPLSFELARGQRAGYFPALISAWVAGAGLAAQAFLQSNDKLACLGCVRSVDPGHPFSALPAGYVAPHEQAPGCVSPHVPYAAPAAVHAAALAGELALVHAGNSKGPHFRTVSLAGSGSKLVKPRSPSPRSDCPLCQN